MKKIIPIILISLFSIFSLQGMPDSLYYRANEKFQNGEFENSIELYRKIILSGYESSTMYYNLGNAYFRSNKHGMARLYYEKALKLNPNNEDAKINLKFMEGLLTDKFDDIPEIFFKKWINVLIHSKNSDNWAIISMFTFVIGFVLLSIYLLLRNTLIRKISFFSSIVLIFVSLLAFVFSGQLRKEETNPSSAIVTEFMVNVKSTPRETGTDLFVLHEGAKVWIEDVAGKWQEIRLSDGRRGWVPSESIEEI